MGQLESSLSWITVLSDDGEGLDEKDLPCNIGRVTFGQQ